ncbi:kinase-like domain-containing protein [Phlebopus sp. FC_14]|nr:kinase-like domain-containing protein [Phlebopus sp. FC_14]
MTNVPAGSKRSWEGHHGEPSESQPYKRQRGREDSKSWRDVHLRSADDKRSIQPSSRRDGDDRREYRSREQERDSRRAIDYSRDRDRRDGPRERDRDRDHKRRDDDRRDDRRRRTSPPRERKSPVISNGHVPPPKVFEDKEEGEISPHLSPRTPSAPPSEPPRPSMPPQPQPELELELNQSEVDEAARAARRAKRQAILAKYAGIASVAQSVSPSPGPSSAVQPPQPVSSVSNPHPQLRSLTPAHTSARNGSIAKRDSASPAPEPRGFELTKDEEEGDARTKAQAQDGSAEQISAADYDPSLDRREDEQKRIHKDEPNAMDLDAIEEVVEEEEEDDVDDMFAVATSEKKRKKVKKVVKPVAPALITTTLDSAADPEGYYQVILGEQLDGGRYQVFSSLGKGMFANVVRARVLQDSGDSVKEVAIKIIRSQESMQRAGLKEVQILNKLRQADPDDKKHIVRLERTFEHRGHLCLVFESMSMNLRDVVKRFGKDVGLNIKAVRAYAHQLFLSLSLLRKTNIMHADIKPDNILVNEQKTLLKLCDLGSASDASENDITPYLVSRFYRAPEIILGVPYDPALDMWSIGCTLYELYTGKILFPGRSNNQMLLLMMELKGRFNTKMIKKAKFGDMYFDEQGAFESIETDRVTGANVARKVHIAKPSRDLRARLMPPASVKLKDDEMKLLTSFIDLLDKCLALDPQRRIAPKEALVHPFIRG